MFENEWFPQANAMGVSWQEFWGMNPHIIKLLINGFREKNELEMQIHNQKAHLQGQYMVDAILATVGNAFKKKTAKPYEYPKKPYEFSKEQKELTEEEIQKQRELFVAQLRIKKANFDLNKKTKRGE